VVVAARTSMAERETEGAVGWAGQCKGDGHGGALHYCLNRANGREGSARLAIVVRAVRANEPQLFGARAEWPQGHVRKPPA